MAKSIVEFDFPGFALADSSRTETTRGPGLRHFILKGIGSAIAIIEPDFYTGDSSHTRHGQVCGPAQAPWSSLATLIPPTDG
jgi:hypothetical protein